MTISPSVNHKENGTDVTAAVTAVLGLDPSSTPTVLGLDPSTPTPHGAAEVEIVVPKDADGDDKDDNDDDNDDNDDDDDDDDDKDARRAHVVWR